MLHFSADGCFFPSPLTTPPPKDTSVEVGSYSSGEQGTAWEQMQLRYHNELVLMEPKI